MNQTDVVVANRESAEQQSGGAAVPGSDDWLSKFDEPFRDALKDVRRASDRQRPVENLHCSDVENEQFDNLPRPRSLPEDVENLISQSSQDLDDETSERTIIRHRLLAIENEVRKRDARGFARSLSAICIGTAIILAWSYGEATRPIIATTPELGRLPEAKEMIAQKVQQLEVDIVAVRQTMEQRLAAQRETVEQLAARQDQMASEIKKLQAADQEILEKIPAPPPPLRKASFRHKHSRRLSVSTKEQ